MALRKAGVSGRGAAHLRGGGLVVEDGGDDHLDLQRLALVGLRREERRLPPLAEVHVEVDAEAVAQLDERAELVQTHTLIVMIHAGVRRTGGGRTFMAKMRSVWPSAVVLKL